MGIPEIIERFIARWSDKQELYMKVGKATEVDIEEYTFTFTPIDETAPTLDVRLKSIVNSTKEAFTIIPKENSFVVVGFHSNVTAQCLCVAESENLIINTTNSEVNAESWVFNNGENGGLVKIEELTQKLNDFVNIFNAHVHSGVTTGPGSSAVSPTQAQTFVKGDYENEQITH